MVLSLAGIGFVGLKLVSAGKEFVDTAMAGANSLGNVDALMASLFEHRKKRGWKDTNSYFKKEFFNNMSVQQWEQMILQVETTLGAYQSSVLTSQNVALGSASTERPFGNYVELVYRVNYEKGVVDEGYLLYQKNKNDSFGIIGLHIK